MRIEEFQSLAKLFHKNGHSLYMIGGTSRDYLLNIDTQDIDLVTSATPEEMKIFLNDADYRYARFGCVRFKHMDITTLREEEDYSDYRHPRLVRFTKDIRKDYSRRDFTINAIYIDADLKVYDFCDGIKDLKNKIIRFIGDPNIRVKEDPLRILRAERFSKKLGFTIESASLKAMQDNRKLIDKLNTNKIKEELRKSHL